MRHVVRLILIIVSAGVFVGAGVESSPNVLEVVVGNGPHAGTYKPPASEVICLHVKKQRVYGATWRYLDDQVNAMYGKTSPSKRDATMINEAAINVSNADEPGAKYGEVIIAFGDRDKKQIRYTVDRVPLTLTIKGKGAEIAFQGKTKDGIQLRVTAACSEVDEM
jgi:hypothetical protein